MNAAPDGPQALSLYNADALVLVGAMALILVLVAVAATLSLRARTRAGAIAWLAVDPRRPIVPAALPTRQA